MPLDHSTCMGSFGHPVSVEAGGLRKVSGWVKEGMKKEYKCSASSPRSGLDWELGIEIRALSVS